jgi:hypothetical protein
MSISPVGNSDAYARYRQQALDLLASPSQTGTQTPQTTAPSYVAPPDSTDQSSANPFATKFKADLTTLGSPQDGKSHAHGAHGHGHHKTDSTDLTDPTTDPTSTTTDSTDPTASTDVFGQAIDDFANLLKSATGTASESA